ncbi:uncharacterized protein LOC134466147 [Engraulis encrasicolus]|uniref:uncharacterized protein LOC134466147 n=1 Tax=Engraulis encrasicolus TaxID=184585 RepID=UPI002FD6E1E2
MALCASMSASVLLEEHLQCPICLHLLVDPVTTACGHNYCRSCLAQYWDKTALCRCPLCKEAFAHRPKLRINTILRDMVELFAQSTAAAAIAEGGVGCNLGTSPSSSKISPEDVIPTPPMALPGEVACDVCGGPGKLRALKSCLDCGTSFCALHLEIHQRAPKLQKHTLTEPLQDLEERVCQKHRRPLELFCREDRVCVCEFCTEGEHKNHNTVPLEEESKERKTKLGKTQAELLEMILDRLDKISEIKHFVELRKRSTEEEVAAGAALCASVAACVERSRQELEDSLTQQQAAAERQADDIITELQNDIARLKTRSTDTIHLLHTEDNLRLLQADPALCHIPETRDWSAVRVDTHVCVESAVRSMEDTLRTQLQKIPEWKLKRIQQYEVDVTLDPMTAHPKLLVSADRKEVWCGDRQQKVPPSPLRFDCCACVLATQRFSSGRHYFQVRVGGKTGWGVGVASESLNRKGEVGVSPEDGLWSLVLRGGAEYWAADHTPRLLTVAGGDLQTLGVFLDYEAGRVSFYDADNAELLYTFADAAFTDRLHPFFSPYNNDGGGNAAPLVILPISNAGALYALTDTLQHLQLRRLGGQGNAAPLVILPAYHLIQAVSPLVTMAAVANGALSAEQFQCPICLDVLNEPVSTPCGHNFCAACIKRNWDGSVTCQCPLCKETFFRRPALKVNTTLRDVAQMVKSQRDSGVDLVPARDGDVPCDVCSGEGCSTKLRALKSCLDCGTSFCALHLEIHQRAPNLQKHTLTEPQTNLEERVCQKHRRPLELFCREDRVCVCEFCTEGEHKNHNTVPLEEESKDRKSELEKTQADLKSMIQERQEKIAEIKHSVELCRLSVDAEAAALSELFLSLQSALERSRCNLQGALLAKQRAVESHADDIISTLQREIDTLQGRDKQLDELSHTQDFLHLLQVYAGVCALPPSRSWSLVSVKTYQDVDALRPIVSRLESAINREMDDLHETQLKRVQQFTELSKVQQYAVNITLDPATANPFLQLSEDRTQVCCGEKRQKVPDAAVRFDRAACVLSREGFCGRFYFQVVVGGKTSWDVGVARDSVTRKGKVKATPDAGYWTVALRNGGILVAKETNPVPLATGTVGIEKVGVFVDYPRGVVSFYDVLNMAHLYSFTGQRFSGRLRPLLSPGQREKGRNTAPLTISVDRPIT